MRKLVVVGKVQSKYSTREFVIAMHEPDWKPRPDPSYPVDVIDPDLYLKLLIEENDDI